MKKLVILGAGESGVGAALLASQKGYDVFVSDKGAVKEKYRMLLVNNKISFEEGMHSENRILAADLIVKSPGIPDKAPVVIAAVNNEIPVVSEIEFAAKYTNAKLIGITGTNGKTTTTLLTHHILSKAGLRVGLAGNVGKSFALQVAENDQDYYVLELSSFQLDGLKDTKIDIAILTNITPDHLDRYEYSFEKYINSKFRIINNQNENDVFIYCSDDEIVANAIKSKKINARQYPFSIKNEVSEGAYVKENQIIININHKQTTMFLEELALQGKHNQYNSMAAGIVARVLEINKDVIKESLSDFQNVEHRLEFVTKVHGIEFINDSKATNVNSTWYALESMQNPVVWILGGVDKGNDYSDLVELAKEKVKAIVCLGSDNKKIIKAFKNAVPVIVESSEMKDAVSKAYKLGSKNDVVLLSPCCASFDLFENYEDRGNQFKKCVRSL